MGDGPLLRADLATRLRAAAATFHAAKPFPHAVLPDVVASGEALDRLTAACGALPWQPRFDELIFSFQATLPPHGPLVDVCTTLASEDLRPTVEALAGRPVGGVHAAAWHYGPGGYLLPHTDSDPRMDRALAFVLHLRPPAGASPAKGGALRLFSRAEPPRGGLPPRWSLQQEVPSAPGQLVLFQVSRRALHAVGQVTGGSRLTLAGWFLGLDADAATTGPSAVPFQPTWRRPTIPRPPRSTCADGWLDAAACARACQRAAQAAWRRSDALEHARLDEADAALNDPLVLEVATWASAGLGEALAPARARWVRLSGGDYALRRDAQARRADHEVAHAWVDVTSPSAELAAAGVSAQGGAPLYWQQGPHQVLSRPQRAGDAVAVWHAPELACWQAPMSESWTGPAVTRLEVGLGRAARGAARRV